MSSPLHPFAVPFDRRNDAAPRIAIEQSITAVRQHAALKGMSHDARRRLAALLVHASRAERSRRMRD